MIPRRRIVRASPFLKDEDGDEKQRNNNTDYGNEMRCDVPEHFRFTSSLQTSRMYKSRNIKDFLILASL